MCMRTCTHVHPEIHPMTKLQALTTSLPLDRRLKPAPWHVEHCLVDLLLCVLWTTCVCPLDHQTLIRQYMFCIKCGEHSDPLHYRMLALCTLPKPAVGICPLLPGMKACID